MSSWGKRALSLIMALIFVFALLPAAAPSANAEELVIHSAQHSATNYPTADNKEQCGDNAWWWIAGNVSYVKGQHSGALVVEGTGAIWDYGTSNGFGNSETNPWRDIYLEAIYIYDGITRVGNEAFFGAHPKDIYLPHTLESIGAGAFSFMSYTNMPTYDTIFTIDGLQLPAGLRRLEDRAFCNLQLSKDIELPAALEYVGTGALSGALNRRTFYHSIRFNGPVKYLGDFCLGNNETMQTVRFVGHAPDHIAYNFLSNVKPTEGNYATDTYCTVYYPAGDSSWDSVINKNYEGGLIKWQAENVSYNFCGNDVTWYSGEDYGVNYTLRLAGTGPMWDFTSTEPGYKTVGNRVERTYIDEGITRIGAGAFKNFGYSAGLTTVIPSTVTSIGSEAFGNSGLDRLRFVGNAPTIAGDAFAGTTATLFYSGDNITFSESFRQNYGGTLTWVGIPVLTGQVYSVYAEDGRQASLSVSVKGQPLNYQWQRRSSSSAAWWDETGANSDAYTPKVSMSMNGYEYRCRIWNEGGEVYTLPIPLTVVAHVAAPPVITTQPVNKTVAEGAKATFKVVATGDDLSYQWQYSRNGTSWTNKTGATSASYTVTAKASYDGLYYRCIVTNEDGEVFSNKAKLTVTVSKPVITTQPANKTVAAGASATFTVAASGTGLTYQWQYSKNGGTSWTNKSGATSASYTVTAKESYNGMLYRCIVTNAGGSVTSGTAKLTVAVAKPVITTQPKAATAAVGASATYKVVASGTGLTYQWQYSSDYGATWHNKTGATSASYTVTAKASYNGMLYRCRVKNSGGTVYSSKVRLTVSGVKPKVLSQPKAATAAAGGTATFKVVAAGENMIYQWQYSTDGGTTWKNKTGATSASYTVTAKASYNGILYRCRVKNSYGTVYSESAKLTVS